MNRADRRRGLVALWIALPNAGTLAEGMHGAAWAFVWCGALMIMTPLVWCLLTRLAEDATDTAVAVARVDRTFGPDSSGGSR